MKQNIPDMSFDWRGYATFQPIDFKIAEFLPLCKAVEKLVTPCTLCTYH